MHIIDLLANIFRLTAWCLVVTLLVYLIYGQWSWRRHYGHLHLQRDRWRYGYGDALDERLRIVELLHTAARGHEHHGHSEDARALRDAAQLVAEPHLIDSYTGRQIELPDWLAVLMRDHRARVAIFGDDERKDDD